MCRCELPGLERVQLVRAKRQFEADLRSGGLAYTILYPNGFFSDMDEFLAMARRGRVVVFGGGGLRINPVDGADVAVAAADAVTEAAEEVDVGGPDVLTHEDIARAAFAALGRPPRITRLPSWTLTGALAVLRRLTPRARPAGVPADRRTRTSWPPRRAAPPPRRPLPRGRRRRLTRRTFTGSAVGGGTVSAVRAARAPG